ncbi:MAG: hypothetical protein II914_05330 [Clostridia bacterium]|nr:hypothetical protein [Clostridia bacterium]
MGGLIVILLQIGFWWFLFRIIKSVANKAKQAANEQGKRGTAASAQPASKPVAPQKPPVQTKERSGLSPRLQQDDYARHKTSPVAPRPRTVVAEGNPEPHVVTPSFGKKHAHTESSMTGFEECPPEPSHAETASEAETLEPSELTFAGKEIIKAMLYSEILSKPKALR